MTKNSVTALVFIFFATVCLLTGCGDSQKVTTEPSIEPPVQHVFDYQGAIDKAISDTIPGIVLLLEKPGFKFLGASGLADIDTQEPMQTYHVMPSGSAGKKLTALLVALLVEDGVLDLDDTLDTWLSAALLAQIEHSESMTLRQLLNHTSGVYDYLDEDVAEQFYQALLSSDVNELKTDNFALTFGLNQPAYALPGTEFHYSNTGYLLAGLILDEVLAEHHSIAIRNRILEPLGMHSSFYGGLEKSHGDIISGYYTDETLGTINTKIYYQNIGFADAPLRSNVEDLALLLKAIAGNEGVISSEVKTTLTGDNSLVSVNATTEYGLGIIKEQFKGKTIYYHGGLEPGYTTENIYIEDTQTSITIYVNCGLTEQCQIESAQLLEIILNNELQ